MAGQLHAEIQEVPQWHQNCYEGGQLHFHPLRGLPMPAHRSLRILVVEDDGDSAVMLTELLRIWGFQARIARNGPAALKAANAERPDVILLDIGLPIIDGWEVAAELTTQQSPRPFVIAVSGYAERTSGEYGVDLHLMKPVDPRRLLALLERFERVHDVRPATASPASLA
jgi:CheY-like chemotaxis protein